MSRPVLALFLLTTFAGPSIARAQGTDWITPPPLSMPQQLWTLMDDKDFSEGEEAGMSSGEAIALLLEYSPDPARSRRNIDKALSQSRAASPGDAALLDRLRATPDLIGVLDQGMRDVGLDKNNLAHVHAAWLISLWAAAHGETQDVSTDAAISAGAQMTLAMLDDPDALMAMDNAARQDMAEGLLIQSALVTLAQQQAAGNAAATARVAREARDFALSQGIRLDDMELTDAGFSGLGN